MQRQSYPIETVLSNKITRNIIVVSFKEIPRKPLGRRPHDPRLTNPVLSARLRKEALGSASRLKGTTGENSVKDSCVSRSSSLGMMMMVDDRLESDNLSHLLQTQVRYSESFSTECVSYFRQPNTTK